MPSERLEAGLVGAAAVEAAAKARFLVLLGEFVARRGWEPWGCVGPVQWLSWQCGLGPVAASEHLRAAEALRRLPRITAALAGGAITWSKVRAVTRVATPANEGDWLNVALSAPAARVEELVRAHRRVTAADVERQEATRSLSWRQEPDGSLVFHLRLPAAVGAAVVAAVAEATTPEAGVPIAARRADALAELVLGPTPSVLIITTAEALAGGPGPCITDHGVAVDAATVAAAACDGAVITAEPDRSAPGDPPDLGPQPDARQADDLLRERGIRPPVDFPREIRDRPPGDLPQETSGRVPAGQGGPGGREAEPGERRWRQHRYPTASTRRALLARDQTCRFPGCHHTGRLDAHHLVHWIHGGPRHQHNLVLLCPGHHRLVHRRQLTLRLEPDGTVAAHRPDGSPLHTPVIPDTTGPPQPGREPVADWDGHPIDLAYVVACLATPPGAAG